MYKTILFILWGLMIDILLKGNMYTENQNQNEEQETQP